MRNHLKRKHYTVYIDNYPIKRTKFKKLDIKNDHSQKINEENIDEPSTNSNSSNTSKEQNSRRKYKSLRINERF